MSRLLNMEKINALPQPIWISKHRDEWWPLDHVCVETGLLKYDVCGLLDKGHFGELVAVRDGDGVLYSPDEFYLEELEAL